MNNREVVDYLAEHLNKPKSEIQYFLEKITSVLKKMLDREKKFTLPGLGTFSTFLRKKRKGYNPQLRKPLLLPPRRVVRFHPSRSLREYVKKMRVDQ